MRGGPTPGVCTLVVLAVVLRAIHIFYEWKSWRSASTRDTTRDTGGGSGPGPGPGSQAAS